VSKHFAGFALRQARWEALQSGLAKQVRNRWHRSASSPQPTLDAIAAYDEKSERLRLVEARPPKPVSDSDRLYILRVLQVVLVVVVLGQRITIPIGSLPISLPLIASYVGIGLLRLRGGAVHYNRVRTELYVAAGAVIVASSWFTSFRGDDISLNSLFLLLIIYLPWVFCVSSQFADLMVPLLRTFVRVMVFSSLVASGEILAQLIFHWPYTDFAAKWLPPSFLAQNYNTSYPISYGNPIYKANAFLFLEPSFLCQFLALALIVSLLLRAPAWQPLLLGLGMAATLSGTGILVIILGVALLVVRVPDRIRPTYVLAGMVGLAIVFSTPAGNILLDRRNETAQQGSSGYIRFVQPYTEVANGLAEDPTRYVVGAGAGSSDRLLTSDRSGGAAVVYTITPKVTFEYGLIAAVMFSAFLLVGILRGPPIPVLPASAALMVFFLSGSLLQPHTIMLIWLLTSIWGPPVTVGVSDALAAMMRRETVPV
jgi:hypothetical protein